MNKKFFDTMKTCKKCKAQVKDNAMFCNFCGYAFGSDETAKRFCPVCGAEASEGSFCSKWGHKLGEDPEPLFDFSEDTAKYDDPAYSGFDEMLKKQQKADEESEEIKHSKVLCIRGEFEEAEKLIRAYVDKHYDRVEGYVALLRIHSKDFTEFEGEQIEKEIKVIDKLSGGSVTDVDYKDYLLAREKHFETKKKAEEDTAKNKTEETARQKAAREREDALKAGFEIDGDTLIRYKGNDRDVKVPDFITVIGEKAFEECKNLTRISLPQGLTTIGEYAFDSCESLTSISLPQGLTTIGKYAFDSCENLTSITIPQSVMTIGENAFLNCTSLKSIVLPAHIDPSNLGLPDDCQIVRK